LEELEATRRRFERPELEGQRARLRRAIRRRAPFKLHDDPFGLTSYAFVKLFEQGRATMKLGGKNFRFSDLTKEDWREGTAPRAFYGGFLYRDSAGAVIFKRGTWIS
jgi:hypothetical protein